MQNESIGLCFILAVMSALLLLNIPGIVHNYEAYVNNGKFFLSPWIYASIVVLPLSLWIIYDRYYRYVDYIKSYEDFLRWSDERDNL